jgi:hypothetical protein
MANHTSVNEAVTKDDNTAIGSDRAFGAVFAVVCGLVFVYIWLASARLEWVWVGGAAAFGIVAALAPRLLHPLNVIWFRFGLLLHHVVTPVVLALMYFVVFLPIGLLMRITGRRPLSLSFDPHAKSYWVKREPPGPSPASFLDQF